MYPQRRCVMLIIRIKPENALMQFLQERRHPLSSLSSRKPYVRETQLAHCREVPLLVLLAHLSGQRFGLNDITQRSELANDFSDAQVNFSLCVKVTKNRAVHRLLRPKRLSLFHYEVHPLFSAGQISGIVDCTPAGAPCSFPRYRAVCRSCSRSTP